MEIQRVEPRNTDEPQGSGSPISRRTVVAVGVAAAWTIPLIQLATAVPAAAASGQAISITGLTGTLVRTATNNELLFNIAGTVNNTSIDSRNPATSSITLIIYIPINVFAGAPTIVTHPSSTLWGPRTSSALFWDAATNSGTLTYTANIAANGLLIFDGIQLRRIQHAAVSDFVLSANAHDTPLTGDGQQVTSPTANAAVAGIGIG